MKSSVFNDKLQYWNQSVDQQISNKFNQISQMFNEYQN